MFKKILVPTDGSDLSRQTAQRAVIFAKEADAQLVLFSATPEYSMDYYGEGGLISQDSPDQHAARMDERARRYLGEIEKMCAEAGVVCTAIAVTSDVPYAVIIEAAEKTGCDLIFMASHGRRGLSAMLLGSETQKVLTHSKIPVLVYR